MSLENYFEQMQQEIRAEIRQKAEKQKAEQEHEQRMKEALQPYCDKGLTFDQVHRQTGCPVSAERIYNALKPSAPAAADAEKEQEDMFMQGFMSDPYSPLKYRS